MKHFALAMLLLAVAERAAGADENSGQLPTHGVPKQHPVNDTGNDSSTSGDEDWQYAEPTDEEIQAELDRKNAERYDRWEANGRYDSNAPKGPARIYRNDTDPFSNNGPLPQGMLRVTSFAGQAAPYAEVVEIGRDLESRDKLYSENGTSQVWGTTYEEDLAWQEKWLEEMFPFLGNRRQRVSAGEEEAATDSFTDAAVEWIADRMPNDLARDNVLKLGNHMKNLSDLAFLGASGLATSSDVGMNEISLVVPGQVQSDLKSAQELYEDVAHDTISLPTPVSFFGSESVPAE